jgi:hypothetical protein
MSTRQLRAVQCHSLFAKRVRVHRNRARVHCADPGVSEGESRQLPADLELVLLFFFNCFVNFPATATAAATAAAAAAAAAAGISVSSVGNLFSSVGNLFLSIFLSMHCTNLMHGCVCVCV